MADDFAFFECFVCGGCGKLYGIESFFNFKSPFAGILDRNVCECFLQVFSAVESERAEASFFLRGVSRNHIFRLGLDFPGIRENFRTESGEFAKLDERIERNAPTKR